MSLTLERSCVKVYPYGCKTPLPILGKCVVDICSNCTDKRNFTCHVTEAATSCILGKSTSELLCVLTVLQPTRSERISALANSDFEHRLNSILPDYKDIFEGTGDLKNFELTIQIDPSVQLCVQKPRRLPFLMKKQVKTEIQKLLDQDFIEPVNSSPEWVSSLVCVSKKNGDVRLCLDMRKTNTAIIRSYYPIPTLDEILYEVNDPEIFSKLDLAQGYHQIAFDEKSRDITTFSTPQGLFRYKRLIFGAKMRLRISRKLLRQISLMTLTVCSTLVMILLPTQQLKNKHLQQLRKVFETIRGKGLKLNLKKCEFGKSSINYMGHILS